MAYQDKELSYKAKDDVIQSSRFEVILLSSSNELFSGKALQEWLPERCQLREITHTSSDLMRELTLFTKQKRKKSLLVLAELEAMGSFSKGFPCLRIIRETHPSVVTMLMTRETVHHDLTHHRLPICDATLHMPFTEDDFDVALYAAAKNNALWQERVEELRYQQPNWPAAGRLS
ncbi:MAG: hypothetical protein LPK02_15420 [Rhodobacterales bacterium]|nr:hypothetical protein [Rhodobacterales bacterium]MDX5414424.1 hypothetical protein [Rhodobacterales bacterium]